MFFLCLSPARKKANTLRLPQPFSTPTPRPRPFGYCLPVLPSQAAGRGSAILSQGALIKAKDRICALIGIHSRGVLFIPFVSEPALFLPEVVAAGTPALLPSHLVTQLPEEHRLGTAYWCGGVSLLRSCPVLATISPPEACYSAPMLDT